MNAETIFERMPGIFDPSRAEKESTYYFSIDSLKRTMWVGPEGCRIEEGKKLESTDCVLKTTEKLFVRLVIEDKTPGAFDIARGKFKTNDVGKLSALKELFDFAKLR